MDGEWRKRQRDWASGQEVLSPEEKLHFSRRAGRLEEGVRALSDQELISLFGGWGIELARGSLAFPEMFFRAGQFDQERFDIWSFVQDRFHLRLQTDADVLWFHRLPEEAQRKIREESIHRPEEMLHIIQLLDFHQNFEHIILPITTFISETLQVPSQETSLIESYSKLLDTHLLSSHKNSTRFESFSSIDLFKKPTRSLRRFLESLRNEHRTAKPGFREQILELIADSQN